jgi:hypothetical protein
MHEATLNTFLCGEVLDVEIVTTTARATVVGDEKGPQIVLCDEVGLSDRESQVARYFSKILDILSSVTTGDYFGLG